ncbi:MAG TPA: M48 family metallopeptidase [Beijerinckiaceae bacterium]|nr:M48 family metallopeptidase [Beijerinckiaceae bacterium]
MAGAYGLYSHIQANRRRSVILIVGLFLLVYAMVFAGALVVESFGPAPTLDRMLRQSLDNTLSALPLATIGTAVWIAIAYRFHQTMIDSLTDSHTVSRAEAPELYNLLENLCISRGLAMPQLKIMEADVLNAFASGMSEAQYAVTVTRGLLKELDRNELEAVLAHELTHIRNGDVRLMVVAVIIAGVIGFFGELAFRWATYSPRVVFPDESPRARKTSPAGTALFIAGMIIFLAWLASGLLRFALSRSREYLADAGAVELTKNPDAMISALMKISGRAELPGAPSGLMEMCIENEHAGFFDLFATHPPIDARIAALVDHAGGQKPTDAPPQPSFTRDAVHLDRRLAPWGRQTGA